MRRGFGKGFRGIGLFQVACISILWLLKMTSAVALEPVRPGQEAFIKRAVFAQSTLWILADSGALSSIREDAKERNEVAFEQPALDLWLQDGNPSIVTRARSGKGEFTVRHLSGHEWVTVARIPDAGDELIGVATQANGVVFLTTRRIVDLDGNQYRVTPLNVPGKSASGGVASILSTPQSLLVGINAGEWGGGLLKIDRDTGKPARIERNETGTLCGGPLNSQCDPVNAIVAKPGHPDCVLIAIGLVHFDTHGRIAEVCGDQVRSVFVKPYGVQPAGPVPYGGAEAISTIAFFGMATVNNQVIAVGIDGLYRIEPDGSAARSPLPEFRNVGNVWVSFALPDVVLLRTELNERRSISGSVPMMVPR